MIKLYLLSKTVHRLFLYLTTYLIIFMSVTGILLKYAIFGRLPFLNLGSIRYLHNEMSIYFAISLGAMMITGIVMYVFPLTRKKNIVVTPPTQTPPLGN